MGISYYLKSDVTGDVKVRVYSGSRVIAEMDGAKTAGVNTVRWNLQVRRERIAGEAAPPGVAAAGGVAAAAADAVAAAAQPRQARAPGGQTFVNIGAVPWAPIAWCSRSADANTRSWRGSCRIRGSKSEGLRSDYMKDRRSEDSG